ncbi:hypothetical protein [Sphingobacterium sp. 40-24]|uniref:hypothetical protein n=1 Tax=Sphingobacterium sp. 40-24 TaxID=1895843 RepID=UPI00257C18DD|nr:hypothetical protein [Sphingobacterium sp. 40-24]
MNFSVAAIEMRLLEISLVCGAIGKKVNKIYIFSSSIKGTYFASAALRYVIFGE